MAWVWFLTGNDVYYSRPKHIIAIDGGRVGYCSAFPEQAKRQLQSQHELYAVPKKPTDEELAIALENSRNELAKEFGEWRPEKLVVNETIDEEAPL